VERFVLEPLTPPSRPAFVVTLEPGEGKSVDAEAPVFRLRRDGAEDDVWSGRGTWEAGHFLLPGVPAGRGVLTVATAGVMAGGSLPWLEASVPVDVPAGGGGSARIPMTMGGWLVITALAPDGRRLDARCRVLGARGERMRGYFMARLGGGNSAGGSGQLSAEAPARLEPPVPAGTYVVELSADGFADRRVEAVVKAGETTKVEATLSAP
jgi:hypothetical protein